jgi:hypothetical protein
VPESFKTKMERWRFFFFPCYRGCGGLVTYIASDWKEIHVEVGLNLLTNNYVGTIFGGSMFGATDPIFMLMLIRLLGPEYTVWDKAATIRYKRPGRGKLTARFIVTDEQVQEIVDALKEQPKIDRTFQTTLTDGQGVVHAEIERVLNIRPRQR